MRPRREVAGSLCCSAPGADVGSVPASLISLGYEGVPSGRVCTRPARRAPRPRRKWIVQRPARGAAARVVLMLEPSLDLYGSTFDSVDGILRELLAKSRARYALIIDRKGFVLMHARALWAPRPPSLDSFATLVASNYAANRAIANLFGEEGFKETVQQGESVNTYLEELGAEALLVTVFDSSA